MSNAQLKEVEYNQDASNAIENMSERGEDQLVVRGDEEEEEEEEQDEDGDVDFNPFLKEALSPEASSSISSEVEALDVDVFESNGETIAAVDIDSLKLGDEFNGSAVGDFEHDEDEIVRQAAVSPGGSCEKELREYVLGEVKKRKSVSMSEPEIDTVRENENGISSETDVNNEVGDRKLSNVGHSRNPVMDIDDEDAICKRTRARYSLASFTLDELETFLQETDDEDDLQNFDDDEEYKKFLTAVLAGGDDDGQADQVSENIDDEDEDNDADFEIEIEEALESDIDENTGDKTQKNEYEKASRRPQTRQNRRQKSSGNNLRKVWQQANRPLRPLVPIMPAPVAPFHAFHGRRVMPEAVPHCLSTSVEDGSINGFSPHQIGQLHCLIHEHLQLLIQVHSLCVLEPSRQIVASQVQGLISEMLCKRDQALSSRSAAYPTFCFRPPYIHPSVLEELPKVYPTQFISESSLTPDAERGSSSPEIPHLHNISPSRGRYEYVSNEQAGPFQTFKGISWFPSITGPLLSILDVAPLNLVGRYMDDVKIAVREYRRRHLEDTCDPQTEREPLFPLPCLPSIAEPSAEVSRETIPTSADMVPSSSPSHQPPKKTLAGTLVENSKKQSVALVPKEIVKVSQRFFPLFNTALFPRKPPPMSVVNRVLFTDAEDELLAMGLMEYNTDWEAIQQRFLPCKSKHQIFVRQKNRCSSKAPENPIKVVKRIKNSPLTADEQARIEEGLRIFNHDWMSVWKFMVPHRDPSLLSRQWRIALGTQKSYKFDAAKREKKRLYESKRRKLKAAYLENWKTDAEREDYQTEIPGENNSGDNSIDIEDEAYVHEAFLADWRPDDSSFRSSELPCSYPRENHLPLDALSQEATCIRGQLNNGSGKYQLQNNFVKDFPHALINSGHPYTSSQFSQVRHCVSNTVGPNPLVPDLTLKSSRAPYYMRPYRARRANSVNLIKLAPDLPPLNLPPSVRVISQSALQGYQYEPSQKVSNAGGGFGGVGLENGVSKLPNITKSGTSHNSSSLQHNITNSQPEDSRNFRDKCVTEEKGPESDLQMHPLLFQAPDGGRLPYYPLNCKTSTSFSFFPRSQPQVSLSLFHNPHKADPTVNCSYESVKSKETNPTSFGTDFHPLLQKTDDRNSDSVTANEKANELDLEIHLSSTSRKEKVIRHRDVTKTKHNLMTSTVSTLGVETQNIKSPYRGLCATTMSKLVSDAPVLAIPSNNDSGFSLENVGDRSLPEIVMEQEELSDSDEETGEPVEFECEEMADSEGEEGSDSEQTAYIQNKESASYAAEKVATLADYDDPQCELRASDDHQGDVLIPEKDGSPLTLGFTSHGKDITRSPPWLSLDSCAPGCPPHSKMKSVESIVGDGRATKDLDSSQPNRSCKKMTPSTKEATAPKHELDMPEQPSQAPPIVNQLRKPRTRSCRTNLNLNTEMTVESSDNDKFG